MKVELIRHTPDPDQLSAEAAAICVGGKPTDQALRAAIESGHLSVLEHQSYTFKIEGISRVCLAQLTRHRMASYSVQSQRYCDVSHEMVTIGKIECSWWVKAANDLAEQAFELYNDLVDNGEEREDARHVLPEGVQTRLIMTMNARELLHFFELRGCNRAQAEIRTLARKMCVEARAVAPITFEHAGPQCKRLGYCPEAHGCGAAPTKQALLDAYKKQEAKDAE